jgi:hypothetical protein
MIHLLAQSGYYNWSVRHLRADAAHAVDRRQRWQHKGAVAGALVSDTLAAPMRLLVGTKGFGTSCTQPDLAPLNVRKLGAVGILNCGMARLTKQLGQGLGATLGGITLPLGLLLGSGPSAWLQGGAARGALLGAAVGRLLIGSAELSRGFNVSLLQAVARVLTGTGALLFGTAADLYAVGAPCPQEALQS